MMTTRLPAASLAVFIFFLFTNSALGSYPKAQNVTWKSMNFKTLLTWGPPPSDYSYTVEFSTLAGDVRRTPNCIQSTATVCDLSSSLTDLKAVYTAVVQSQQRLGQHTDLAQGEFPFTTSPRFSPYTDTEISRPHFKLEVNEDRKTTTTLYVTDPLTALFKDNHQQSIRDIFGGDLQYKVTYRKNKSTGKKTHISKNSTIEIAGLDRGESYCFQVQAYIPSRSVDKQLGEMSEPQCSRDESQSIFDMYSMGVIAGGILVILVVIAVIVAVTVVCCKRRRSAKKHGKEAVPLSA